MSTLKSLKELERETFNKGNQLRKVPLDLNVKNTKESYKIIEQQKELEKKYKFCWGLIRSIEKEKENEKL